MISLPNVTLIAVDNYVSLASVSLDKCVKDINFRYCSLIKDFTNYNEFCLKHMASHIKTSHALIVQYDSWIIYPEMWTDEFLEYDYIGAKWPHLSNQVGNGGFSLRSKKLLDILADQNYPDDVKFEDGEICLKMRSMLEDRGIKFAPEIVADKFSYERASPTGKTFGFHGLFNMWRHVDDDEMIKMAALFPDYVVKKTEYHELINNYRSLGKFNVLEALLVRLK